jgi:hypothetical protein
MPVRIGAPPVLVPLFTALAISLAVTLPLLMLMFTFLGALDPGVDTRPGATEGALGIEGSDEP